MSIADQLDALLAASETRLTDELHDRDPEFTTARAYARALWALQDDLRRLATTARATEGARS
ncbi:hypothetical protein ACFWQG_12945 [Rhodococcus sp. NPDC058532]|uniref:hypothetical protein n=1 Tax=Rhodococcus sp. NPDC058532 TaxID=3346540 RepID=UPI00365A841C